MRRRRFLKLLWATPPAILLLLYANGRYTGTMNGRASRLLMVIFGGFVSFDGIGIMQALAFCLLFVVQLTLLGNEFRDDFEIASAYLFTRGKKRGRWLVQKFVSIAAQSMLYYLILFATVLFCVPMMGYTFDSANVLSALIYLLLTLVLTNTLFVLAVNLLTLRMSVPLVYAFTIIFYTGWITLLPLLKDFELLLRLIPVSRSILLIHALPISFGEMREGLSVAFRISILDTILWMLFGVGMLYAMSFIWIKKTDLLGGNDA